MLNATWADLCKMIDPKAAIKGSEKTTDGSGAKYTLPPGTNVSDLSKVPELVEKLAFDISAKSPPDAPGLKTVLSDRKALAGLMRAAYGSKSKIPSRKPSKPSKVPQAIIDRAKNVGANGTH